MLANQEFALRTLEATDGLIKEAQHLLHLAAQGLYSSFQKKAGSMLLVLQDFIARYEEGITLTAVESIADSLKRIMVYANARSNYTTAKIEFELLPLLKDFYNGYYFFNCVFPDRTRMDKYYQNELATLGTNEHIDRSVESGSYKYDLSISVLAFNKLEFTKQCIDSLMRYIPQDLNYELILINHGSTDGTKTFFESIGPTKQLNILRNGGGIGAHTRIYEGRYHLEISNDVIITENAIANMIRCMESDEQIAWVVPTTPNVSNLQTIPAKYATLEEMHAFASKNNEYPDPFRWEQRARLCNPISLRRTSISYSSYGVLFSPYFHTDMPGGFLDDKEALFYRRNGYKMMLAKDSYCYHFGSVTLKEEIAAKEAFYEKGRKVFHDAFGIDPWGTGVCWSTELMSLLPCVEQGHVNILGLNCGIGSNPLKIKESIKENVHNLEVTLYNVTDNENYTEDLRGISDVAECMQQSWDVNQIFAGVKFDYILFETGLENYPKPMRMVRKLERRLTVGGYLALRTSSPALKKGIREIYPTVSTAGDWSVISEQTFLSRNNRPKHDTVICLNSKPEGTSAEPTSIVPREEMHDQGLENQHGKDMPKTTTSIIIPVPKSKKQLRDCVRAIEKHTPETFEIVFVSSIPKGKAPKWLKETLRQNKGYCFFDSHGSVQPGKIYNEGIKGSVGDYVVLLAPDIVVFDGWLSGMLSCLNRIQDAGIVAPMTNRAKGIQKIPSPDDHSIDRLDAFSRSFTERNRYRRVSVLKTEGFCMLFKRELTEHIGLLSEEVDSDDLFAEDFSLRAASVGYSNLIAGDVFVHRQEQTAMKKSAPPTKWVSADFQSSFQNKSFVPSLIAKARGLDQQDKADLALKSLIDGIGQVPDDKRLYQTLAELLLRHGQYQDALDALNEMPGGEGDLRKLELTAYSLEGLEKYPEAGAYAEEILSCDPDSSLALNLKGILAYRQGDKDKAEMLFKGSIESDPGFGEPHTNLGVLKWEGGEPDQALDLLERGFILSPILTDVVTLYHTAITDLSRFDRAEPILRDAVALYPSDKRLKHLLIDDLIKQAKHSQAMEVIEEAMVSFDLQEGFLRAALEVRKRVGPYTTIDAVEKGYSVSLCMIVKDEEQYLAQCLASLKPVVDEIIVIDTGSKDQTKDIAKVFGAQVFDYEWNDDFSTARNSAIEKASGDWIVVMDADEVISTQDHEQLRQLIKRSHAGHVAFSFTTRNYINQVNTIGFHPNKGDYAQEEAAMGWMPSDKVRLFPNNGDIRFEFPIHEKVEPSLRRKGLEIKRCQVPVHHYGKLNEEKGDKKCAAYYELGRKKLDELGGDIDAIRELAVQAETIGKETEAIELWQRLLTLQPNAAIALVNMATLYLKLNRYEEARETAQQAAHIAPQMKEALHNYALCEFYCGNVDQTITLLQRALEQDPDYLSARFLLAVAYCCAGTQSEGLRIFSELESTTGRLGLAVACHTFAEKLVAAQKADYAMSLLKTAVGAKYSNPDVIKLYDQLFQTWTKTTLSGSSNSGFGTVRKDSPNPSVYGALQ